MEGLEMICFQIISGVGAARSSYIEAIQKAKAGDFEGAEACMEAGQQEFLKGHEAHFELIQKEAQGVQVGGSLILVHAEDQLMSAEGFKIIAEEMIAAYKRIAELEKKVNKTGGYENEKSIFILQRRNVYQYAGQQNAGSCQQPQSADGGRGISGRKNRPDY